MFTNERAGILRGCGIRFDGFWSDQYRQTYTQTYSPHVMSTSGFQIEAGFVSERPFNGVDLYNVSYGTLDRYGITDWVEVRLSTQYGAVRINGNEEEKSTIQHLASSSIF